MPYILFKCILQKQVKKKRIETSIYLIDISDSLTGNFPYFISMRYEYKRLSQSLYKQSFIKPFVPELLLNSYLPE